MTTVLSQDTQANDIKWILVSGPERRNPETSSETLVGCEKEFMRQKTLRVFSFPLYSPDQYYLVLFCFIL